MARSSAAAAGASSLSCLFSAVRVLRALITPYRLSSTRLEWPTNNQSSLAGPTRSTACSTLVACIATTHSHNGHVNNSGLNKTCCHCTPLHHRTCLLALGRPGALPGPPEQCTPPLAAVQALPVLLTHHPSAPRLRGAGMYTRGSTWAAGASYANTSGMWSTPF